MEFYKRIASYYGVTNFDSARANYKTWRFEPHVAEKVFNQWLKDSDIPVYKECRLIHDFNAVKKENNKIISFQTENGKEFRASIFIDCSYEGDLLYYAGVSTIIGRESNSVYGETKNGIRTTNTYRNFEVPVDPYIISGDPRSGLIHTIQDEKLEGEGEGDQRIQAYCFRACLTNDSTKRVPFQKAYKLQQKLVRDLFEVYRCRWKVIFSNISIPNRKTDLGAWHDLSHNLYGMNHAYPSGSYKQRDSIYQYHLDFFPGLVLFFVQRHSCA